MTDFNATRAMFDLPEGLIYLDGNSLGPLPRTANHQVDTLLREEWGKQLIKGWNACGWMDTPRRIGDRIAKIIGAGPGTVVIGDTLSIKVYQALAAALALRPERSVVLSDTGNFPTDLYMAEGLLKTMGGHVELRLVEPHEIEDAIDDSVAAVMLTQADYRSGRLHNMRSVSTAAHAAGALTVWDLAHTAGAVEVRLDEDGADFAVGCTYKYLNGGPGAPAFIYVAERHQHDSTPALSGWLGHEQPFAFDLDYRPGAGIDRMRVGTPPVIACAALDAALDIWDMVDIRDVRARSIELSECFIEEVEHRCPQLTLASPRDPQVRGSQVSFEFEEGYAVIQALIANDVIGDFRAPDKLRFGFTPLYLSAEEVIKAAQILERIMSDRLWDCPEFKTMAAVT